MHAHAYDLGLVVFGVNSLTMGLLVGRPGIFAKAFGAVLAIARIVHVICSGLRFFAAGWSLVFAPACMLAILAEAGFCLHLPLQRRAW